MKQLNLQQLLSCSLLLISHSALNIIILHTYQYKLRISHKAKLLLSMWIASTSRANFVCILNKAWSQKWKYKYESALISNFYSHHAASVVSCGNFQGRKPSWIFVILQPPTNVFSKFRHSLLPSYRSAKNFLPRKFPAMPYHCRRRGPHKKIWSWDVGICENVAKV